MENKKYDLNKTITISRLDFLKICAEATTNEAIRDLTKEVPAMILAFTMYSSLIATELFDKSDEEKGDETSEVTE